MIATPEFAKRSSAAFTLLELSVVLVVIGLLVGGVLVGKDLVDAAKIRAQISQIESYQASVKTFKLKYNCLAGDCKNAAQFGLTPRGVSTELGDGNDLLEGRGSSKGAWPAHGELLLFWKDLSQTNLIPESFSVASTGNITSNIEATTSPALSDYLPRSKLSDDVYVLVHSGTVNCCPTWYTDGKNYFSVIAITRIGGSYQARSL